MCNSSLPLCDCPPPVAPTPVNNSNNFDELEVDSGMHGIGSEFIEASISSRFFDNNIRNDEDGDDKNGEGSRNGDD